MQERGVQVRREHGLPLVCSSRESKVCKSKGKSVGRFDRESRGCSLVDTSVSSVGMKVITT